MRLSLPALALGIERYLAVKLHPRHIHTEKLFPDAVTSGGSQIRLFIYNMLKMVNHGAVGNKGQRTGKMRIEELALILAEEIIGVFPREELH